MEAKEEPEHVIEDILEIEALVTGHLTEQLFVSKKKDFAELWACTAFHMVHADLANLRSVFQPQDDLSWCYKSALLLILAAKEELDSFKPKFKGYFGKMLYYDDGMAIEPDSTVEVSSLFGLPFITVLTIREGLPRPDSIS